MEKYKILIIEDDPIIQTELQVLLNGNGYEASAVTDFTSVMQAVKNTHPYLILLDIKLPQESGYSICSQIRSFSNVPIIFVTSRDTKCWRIEKVFKWAELTSSQSRHDTLILLEKIKRALQLSNPNNFRELVKKRLYPWFTFIHFEVSRAKHWTDKKWISYFVLLLYERR